MPTQRPLSFSTLRGRSPANVAEEALFLQGLTELVPDIRYDVLECLGSYGMTESVLLEEIEHAETQIVCHWYGCALTARRLWGWSEKDFGSEALVPESWRCPEHLQEEWEEFLYASRDTMRATAALNPAELENTLRGFASNLLERSVSQLPDGANFKLFFDSVKL